MSAVRRLLVANRGEIACRIFRTCARLGIETVAVFSDPDRNAVHTRTSDRAVSLGGSTAAESYLDLGKVLAAAQASGADAVHPGYGFLAENADLAQAVLGAGLTWVGPAPATIRLMGAKVEAKRLATQAGVPVAASAELLTDDPADWLESALTVGFPLLVKASAGGGGKGMRLVLTASELADAVKGCRREAAASFGDATVFLERYVVAARHVEVQVFGDSHGNLVHLYERECSIQRRHQKVLEESPSPGLGAVAAERMYAAALALAGAVDYLGAGTVEFLLEDLPGEQAFVFLEMNTRLQVEHAVTEAVTGLDLVEWQLDVAAGRPLPLRQDEIARTGHAIEVRLYAEDPARGHLPSAGRVRAYREPTVEGVRHDSGIVTGSEVSTHYDPLLAKVIGFAPTREQATARLAHALRRLTVDGIGHNRDSLVAVLEHPEFAQGRTPTTFLDDHPEVLAPTLPARVRLAHLAAAALGQQQATRAGVRVQGFVPPGFRNVAGHREKRVYAEGGDGGRAVEVAYATGRAGLLLSVEGHEVDGIELDGTELDGTELDGIELGRVRLTVDGVSAGYDVRVHPEAGSELVVVSDGRWTSSWAALPRFKDLSAAVAAGGLSAPLPGTVTLVGVRPGDSVTAGQTLVVLEAMKMEHRIVAPHDGVIDQVLVAVGDAVDAHSVVVRLVEAGDDE